MNHQDECMLELKKPLKERPDVSPKFSPLKGVEGSLFINSDHHRIYCFLRDHPNEVFCGSEVKEKLKLKSDYKHCGDLMRVLSKRGFIFRIPLLVRSIGSRGAYLYSFSEKALWQRFWTREVPKKVMEVLNMIYNSSRGIFSMQQLIDDNGITRKELEKWFGLCFYRDWMNAFGNPLIARKRIEGIRTFFYKPTIPEIIFDKLYEQYYKEKIISQKKLLKVNGNDFEDFSTWTFSEYLKIKGMNIELTKCDKEPIDYIIRIIMNIDDITIKETAKKAIELCKYGISCKNYRFDRPIGSGYVIGMSGCLREGLTWRGEQVFRPRNTTGVICCTRAYPSAYEMAGKLGILIFDLSRLLQMHRVVMERTGLCHPLYKKISLRIQGYREKIKGGRNFVSADQADVGVRCEA